MGNIACNYFLQLNDIKVIDNAIIQLTILLFLRANKTDLTTTNSETAMGNKNEIKISMNFNNGFCICLVITEY